MSDFEQYTRTKIAALRVEADNLERLLREYADNLPTASMATEASAPDADRARKAAQMQPVARRRRGNSGFGKVMDAIGQAGPAGLSIDHMMEVAQSAGQPIARNTLRSMLFNEKKKGRLKAVSEGVYAFPGLNDLI